MGRNISKTAARELATVERGKILKGEAGIGGAKPPPAAPTVRQYTTTWLSQIAPELAPGTVATYRHTMTHHVLPALGDVPLDGLDVARVKALLADKAQEGYAKNSLQGIRSTLSTMLGDAIEDGVLTTNVVKRLHTRKKRHGASKVSPAERAKTLRPLTLPDLSRLLDAARSRDHEWVLLLTLADTGARPGEVLALRWNDLNLADQTLHIERSVTLGGVIKGTKTGVDRYVELTPRLVAALTRWHQTSQLEASAAGRELSPWIFPSRTGEVLRVHAASKRFRRLRTQAGIGAHHRLYDLLWAKRLQESREFHPRNHSTPESPLEQPALSVEE